MALAAAINRIKIHYSRVKKKPVRKIPPDRSFNSRLLIYFTCRIGLLQFDPGDLEGVIAKGH